MTAHLDYHAFRTADDSIEESTSRPVMINREQAAKRLCISIRALDRMIKENTIPSTKIAGRRLFHVATLEQWAASQCALK